MTTPALSIRGVRRTFGPKVAVDDVDLTIEAGTFTGLLGPSGAGKSTLIACTVGLDRPDAGTSEVFGHDVWEQPEQARRLMGVLPDNLAVPEYLSGRELLGHWGRLHGLNAAEVDARADSLLRVLELGAVLTVVGYLLHPAPELLPWVLWSFLAVLGGGAGLVVYLSIALLVPGTDPHRARYSPAEQGDLTGPAFLALFLALGLAAPTAGLLTVWQVTGSGVWAWLAAAVALLTAGGTAWWLGALATGRLRRGGPELLHRMRSGPLRQAAAPDAPGTMDHVRAALRGEVLDDPEGAGHEGRDGTGPDDPAAGGAGRRASAYEAMTLGEQRWFWALYVLAILALIPQGLVAIGHLLAGSDARIWFLALWLPEPWRWPTAVGFVVLALVLAGTATSLYRRGRRRVSEQMPDPAGDDHPAT